jgi:hypothetical protein
MIIIYLFFHFDILQNVLHLSYQIYFNNTLQLPQKVTVKIDIITCFIVDKYIFLSADTLGQIKNKRR